MLIGEVGTPLSHAGTSRDSNSCPGAVRQAFTGREPASAASACNEPGTAAAELASAESFRKVRRVLSITVNQHTPPLRGNGEIKQSIVYKGTEAHPQERQAYLRRQRPVQPAPLRFSLRSGRRPAPSRRSTRRRSSRWPQHRAP